MRGYHLKGGVARRALKIDLRKAYDTVNWSFILNLLHAIHHQWQFVQCIKVCITSPKNFIFLNGVLEGNFKGGHGLRQAGPLSPYLFVMAMEVFSWLMANMIDNSGYTYHTRCEEVGLSHFCFADDLIIFLNGDRSLIEGI